MGVDGVERQMATSEIVATNEIKAIPCEVVQFDGICAVGASKVEIPLVIQMLFEEASARFWHGIKEECGWSIVAYP